jgi:predicted flap endonuclease-1-like 5' DNA nuclease
MRILIAGPLDAQKKELPIRNSQKPKTEVDPKKVPEHLRARLFPQESAAQELLQEAEPKTVQVESGAAGGSRAFLQELDTRIGRKAAPSDRAYYDYAGDVHDVEELEGIGRIYGNKLRELGVQTTARLAYEEPEELARRMSVPVKTVQQWQSMAELVKVKGIGKQYAEAMARAGIQGIAEMKKRSPDAIADQVNGYLDSLETNVLGTKITAKRVEGWQKAAAGMKRVRLKVPEQ